MKSHRARRRADTRLQDGSDDDGETEQCLRREYPFRCEEDPGGDVARRAPSSQIRSEVRPSTYRLSAKSGPERAPGLATSGDAAVSTPHRLTRILAANPFFAELGQEAIQSIAGLCRTVSVARNEVLFQKGDPGDALYAIRRGQIRIAACSEEGRSVTLNLLGAGDVFGEIALLDGHARTAEAVALEATDLFVIERRDFLGLLTHDATLAVRIIEFLCQRLRWMSERMEEATLLPLDARLARRLIMLSEDYGAEIQVTQQELAAYVGAARESVNRVLQDWRRSGIIDLGRSRVNVKFAQRLAALGGPSRI